MAVVAFLALALAVIVQTVRLNQALIREQRLRAEAELQRAEAQRRDYFLRMVQAEREWAEEQRQAPPAAPKP
jgi:hypothetical protein